MGNFEMVKREFVKFKRRRFSSLPEEESVVFKCWENLLALEVILPKVGDRVCGQQLEYVLNTSHLRLRLRTWPLRLWPRLPRSWRQGLLRQGEAEAEPKAAADPYLLYGGYRTYGYGYG